ncbi:hypothetical protein PEPS_34750 (plasmid) [Persicobacter psychrovividus]|uniref:Uncharacterized protein n=1 Tax=Persicobacter psychrovividus TaxID=387638 RepID=A0ABM7VJP7_9BACT|nr:hypothetical protein PEPS_34750 [Persicobacter psychrovividus]
MKVIEVNNFKTRNRPVRIRMQGGVGGVLVKEEIFFHQPSTRFNEFSRRGIKTSDFLRFNGRFPTAKWLKYQSYGCEDRGAFRI